MYALITWSLGAVGYFASLWLVLLFTQRMETELDEARRVTLGGRGHQDRSRRPSAATSDGLRPRVKVAR